MVEPKPLLSEMNRFIKLSSRPGIRTRVSEKQKRYSKFMPAIIFGDDEMICTVDRVIMSCELWWVQHNATKHFEIRHIFDVLSQVFKQVNYNGHNDDGDHPLIPEAYLRRFLEHSTTSTTQTSHQQVKEGKERSCHIRNSNNSSSSNDSSSGF